MLYYQPQSLQMQLGRNSMFGFEIAWRIEASLQSILLNGLRLGKAVTSLLKCCSEMTGFSSGITSSCELTKLSLSSVSRRKEVSCTLWGLQGDLVHLKNKQQKKTRVQTKQSKLSWRNDAVVNGVFSEHESTVSVLVPELALLYLLKGENVKLLFTCAGYNTPAVQLTSRFLRLDSSVSYRKNSLLSQSWMQLLEWLGTRSCSWVVFSSSLVNT